MFFGEEPAPRGLFYFNPGFFMISALADTNLSEPYSPHISSFPTPYLLKSS